MEQELLELLENIYKQQNGFLEQLNKTILEMIETNNMVKETYKSAIINLINKS